MATGSTNGHGNTASNPPEFQIGGPAAASWREAMLTRVAEQRALAAWLRSVNGNAPPAAAELADAIDEHLKAAREAAEERRFRGALGGAAIERTVSNLDAVESHLMRLAPDTYLRGQLPSIVAHVRRHLAPEDPRRLEVERIAKDVASPRWEQRDRENTIAAVHAASSKARREVRQVRSFRNTLWATAAVLLVAAGGTTAIGIVEPGAIPLCFNPEGSIVCPTSEVALADAAPTGQAQRQVNADIKTQASRWDMPIVMLLGMIAAAVSAAVALRNIEGTATPFSLPIALAVLKLPTGALTAVLGLLLMRGEFVPGLSALDSSAQILAWAVVFGYAQQLLTMFVDRQAHSVLGNVRAGGTEPDAGDGVTLRPGPVG